ncbi:MarR family winged helix-turn-helix transcriptional regulator [Litorimonas sp. RW-G-Af-16]|uniref:MarR family winged helix-turn-helix transcriptional regulator n=1 Tax=Litorimonas sp. RW-G-Af-16 TaxID=3241168 RepID=UPI00390C5CD3
MAIARTVDRRLFFLLDRSHQQLAQRAEHVLAQGSGISRSQAAVLIYLGYHDGCTLTELALGTGRKNAAISGLTDRMVEAGLISRQNSYGDRRTRTVNLTEAGWAKREVVMEDFRDFNTKLVKGLSEAEVNTVLKFLTLSVENVS